MFMIVPLKENKMQIFLSQAGYQKTIQNVPDIGSLLYTSKKGMLQHYNTSPIPPIKVKCFLTGH